MGTYLVIFTIHCLTSNWKKKGKINKKKQLQTIKYINMQFINYHDLKSINVLVFSGKYPQSGHSKFASTIVLA